METEVKPYDQPTLPIRCPHRERTIYIAVAKLQQSVVGVVCTGCRKSIPMTPDFLEAIRHL